MINYYLSERLKIKNTFTKKLSWFMPLLTVLLSAFLAQSYFQIDSYNWWYAMMLPGTVALSCALLWKVDGKINNKAVLSLPLDLKKVWLAKILIGAKNLFFSCMLIFLCVQASPFFLSSTLIVKIPFLKALIASVVLSITYLWQIPTFMFLSSKLGLFPTTLISMLFNISGTIAATLKFWWAIPFTYPARLMCPILGILPNGLLAVPKSQTFTPEVLSFWSIPTGIGITVVLFAAITYLTAKWFENQEVK